MAKANQTAAAVEPVTRTSAGLRDAIFDEMDAIRNGSSNATRANAVSKLAGSIVETVRMELEVQRYVNQTQTKVSLPQAETGLPRALSLGA